MLTEGRSTREEAKYLPPLRTDGKSWMFWLLTLLLFL